VDLPGWDIQVNFVERDDIIEQLRESPGAHRAGITQNLSSSHTENLQDTSNLCVDGG
jgi:hypothetical protein